MQANHSTRRVFLSAAAGTLGMLSTTALAPASVLGANDRLRIAIIGCGGRGTYLMETAQSLDKECSVEIAAVCDVSKKAMQAAATKAANAAGRQPFAHQRYREILSRNDVDAVMIATADFAHARILTEAALAGKHAYCEKPMSNNIADANAAVDAVEAKKVICQVGTQRRSHVPHHQAVELVRSGVLGIVSEIECQYNRCEGSWLRDYSGVQKDDVDWDQFLMNLPKREFDPCRYRCWHLFKDYSIGLAGLLGAHVIDVGPWFMDDPLPLCASAEGATLVWKEKREQYDTLESVFQFPKGFLLCFTSRLGNSAGGTETQIRGTKGTFDTATLTASGEGGGRDAIKEPIKINQVGFPDWSDAKPHIKNWLDCIRSGKKPNADVHAGYSHSVASIMAHQAADLGRRLRYDPAKRDIV
ncbi:MAG: Gfo/Idh/MocA family oxidoreductase [Candidatus Omnitrophota bacterium]